MKVVIVDDNLGVINAIRGAIEKEFEAGGMSADINIFTSVKNFKEHIQEYDLCFLDISLPEQDGVELAQEIKAKRGDTDIIFISSREERVFDTFKVAPFSFIRKSNFLMDCSEVIQRYVQSRNEVKKEKREISLLSRNQRINLPLADIAYIEGKGVNQCVYFISKEKESILVSSRMEDLEKELYEDGFLRIHKGYLVNFRFIKSINSDMTLTLKDERILIISRRKIVQVKQRFLELCKKNDILTF
jgi:two-component system, LytTR family, response regulator LytT